MYTPSWPQYELYHHLWCPSREAHWLRIMSQFDDASPAAPNSLLIVSITSIGMQNRDVSNKKKRSLHAR
jgi:hypothetical protein